MSEEPKLTGVGCGKGQSKLIQLSWILKLWDVKREKLVLNSVKYEDLLP